MLDTVQGSMVRTTLDEHLSIFDIGNTRGMLPDSVKKLPTFVFSYQEKKKTSGDEIPCAICLQEFGEGDIVRRLPKCRHHFHMVCIDRWLTIDASCPTCRQHVG
ncbi:RING-H2 finger protein [Nymphaea thermarum]|nr:RING-H2 finger protein [Nymphaea thermarum]